MNHNSTQNQLVLKTDSGEVCSRLLSISLATGNFLYLEKLCISCRGTHKVVTSKTTEHHLKFIPEPPIKKSLKKCSLPYEIHISNFEPQILPLQSCWPYILRNTTFKKRKFGFINRWEVLLDMNIFLTNIWHQYCL